MPFPAPPVLAAAALVVATAGAAHAQPSFAPRAVEMPGARVEVPMELVQGARATVRAMVNGHGPFVFAIETGAPMVIVTDRLAAAIGLPTTPEHEGASVHGAGSIRTLDSLRIGDALFRDQPVAVMPPPLPGIDGLLGLPAYASLLLTVDYPGRRVVLERGALPEPDGREVLAARAVGPFLAIPVRLGAREVTTVIDTQSGLGLSVPPALADSLAFEATPAVVGQARVGGMTRPAAEVKGARLAGDARVGGFTIARPIVRVLPMPAGYMQMALFGTGTLRHFAITLDQANRRVRLARRDPVVPAEPPFRSLGLALGVAPGVGADSTVSVSTLLPGGAAAAAGLRVGDTVRAVGGRPARELLIPTELAALAERGESVRVEVVREGRRSWVGVTPTVLVR